jgi:hypothetical protein
LRGQQGIRDLQTESLLQQQLQLRVLVEEEVVVVLVLLLLLEGLVVLVV